VYRTLVLGEESRPEVRPKLGLNIPLYDPMVHCGQVRDAWAGVRIPDGR
jgi:hypothetical protein